MSELNSISLFDTILYKTYLPEYLDNKDFMSVCDEYTDKAISNAKNLIDERNKKFKTDVKDHGMSYHSGAEMYKDKRFDNFQLLIKNTARNILENQGFDLSNYSIDYTEMWIQKFAYEGGGHQDTHVHSKLCAAMERQIVSVKPGSLLLFNSWLPHQFSVDNGIDPFRFIHFNLQAKMNGKK